MGTVSGGYGYGGRVKEYGGADMREDLKTRLQREIADKFEQAMPIFCLRVRSVRWSDRASPLDSPTSTDRPFSLTGPTHLANL